jgi:predicted DCC family thiol-disulfide oxidoreductase YuxK
MGSNLRSPADQSPGPVPGPVVLYDGVCGLCNRYVQFLLRRDRGRVFRFAALQGAFGQDALTRHGIEVTGDPQSIVLLESPGTPNERLRVRSDAVLASVARLGGPWRCVGALRLIPRFLRDGVYDFVARVRYRLFGRFDVCAVPPGGFEQRFID